jgi:hypothetical protein
VQLKRSDIYKPLDLSFTYEATQEPEILSLTDFLSDELEFNKYMAALREEFVLSATNYDLARHINWLYEPILEAGYEEDLIIKVFLTEPYTLGAFTGSLPRLDESTLSVKEKHWLNEIYSNVLFSDTSEMGLVGIELKLEYVRNKFRIEDAVRLAAKTAKVTSKQAHNPAYYQIKNDSVVHTIYSGID